MAEIQKDNLFASLRRLFSTDVIIRNTGTKGGGIQVMDTDNIQTTGVIQTNSLIDRFHKVYTTSTAYGVNLNLAQNYQSARVQIYADYDAMDTDAIISSALDIIADECLGGETIIPLLDGSKKTIKSLYEEGTTDFWLYGLDKNQAFAPVKAQKVAYNGKKLVYKITLDDGTEIKATGNHIWIDPEGAQVTTDQLKIGSSILALPTKISDDILRRIICNTGYSTLTDFAKSTNHKVVSLEECGYEDVYDVVNAGDNHIFAIETKDGSKLYTHNCTLKDENGVLLRITSADENIQNLLEQLFYSVLNVEFNLWGWVRNMCKYGDFYLKMEISEEFGIYNVIPFSAYNIVRQEGFNPHNPNEVRFKFDPNAALGSTTGYTSAYNNQDPGIWFDNYEMAHFRFTGDVNYLPYGKSYLENARKLFKQYTLIEDAMLIHRIVRAPDKRAYYVNVGAIPPAEVENYVQRMMNKMKKTPLVDPSTGEYNMKYNVQNMLEDYFIPFRGNGDTTRIDTIPGLTYNGIEDVQYFREKVFAALKIPKAFMGYEKDLTGKATLAAEDIRFARTIERIQRIIVSELKKIALVHLYANGYEDESVANFQLSLVGPSIIYEQERLAMLKEKVDLLNQASDAASLPRDYIWKNVFHISEDEFTEMEDMIIEDQKRKFRYKQIQEEGNDPVETGQAFGTPHQLASLYGGKQDRDLNVPSGYNELDPNRPTKVSGRPQKYKSTYGTDDSPFGRDRLGSYDLKSNAETGEDSFKPKFKGGPLNLENTVSTKALYAQYQNDLKKMFPKRKTVLFESTTLDEDNIIQDLEK